MGIIEIRDLWYINQNTKLIEVFVSSTIGNSNESDGGGPRDQKERVIFGSIF